MKNKLIISAIAAVIVSFAILTGFTVSADTVAKTDSVEAKRGEEVTIKVTLEQSVSVKSGAISLQYDKNVLKVVSGTWDVPGAVLVNFDMKKELGAFACQNAVEIKGTIFTLTVEVLEDADFGECELRCTLQLRDPSGDDIEVTSETGSVTVICEHEYDDVCDPECNICKQEREPEHAFGNTYSHDKDSHWLECSLCGERKDEEEHKGGRANCINKAVCTVCREEYGELDDTRHEHTELQGVIDATCVDRGYTGDTYCTDCDTKIATGRATNATGVHSWDKGKVTKEATETEEGVRTYTCTVCKTTKTEAIPRLAHKHSFSSWEPNGAQKHKRTCDCGETEEAAHTWDKGTVTKAATKTETGIMTYECTACGYTRTEVIPLLTDHVHEFGAWKSDGPENHKRTCKTCDTVETAPHAWGQGEITTPATHTSKGEITYQCADCKDTMTETIEIISEHIWDNGVVTVPATHESEGKMTYTCSVCGETKEEVIPTNSEHVWNEGVITRPATHTEEGEILYTCTICNETKTEAILAVGHTFGNWMSNDTEHWMECECGAKEAVSGHSYGKWSVTKEATETEKGVKQHVCTVCGHAVSNEIPKIAAAQPIDSGFIVIGVCILLIIVLALAYRFVYRKREGR